MGLFDKVFRSQRDIAKEEMVKVPWHPLNEVDQLEEIKNESEEGPVVIFKHSTRCGISRMVLNNFERNYDLSQSENLKLYFLDLLSHREVSSAVASDLQVRHESPQLIIIKDREVVHQASHQAINLEDIKAHL